MTRSMGQCGSEAPSRSSRAGTRCLLDHATKVAAIALDLSAKLGPRRNSSGGLAMIAANASALACAQEGSKRPRANQCGWLGASNDMVFAGAPLASLVG